MDKIKLENDEVLVLRRCHRDMSSPSSYANRFKYPKHGYVAAPDWDPTAICGGGLHGFLRGEGNPNFSFYSDSCRSSWLLLAAEEGPIVRLGEGKVKFPEGRVVFAGSLKQATKILKQHYPNAAVMGYIEEDENKTISIVGDEGKAKGEISIGGRLSTALGRDLACVSKGEARTSVGVAVGIGGRSRVEASKNGIAIANYGAALVHTASTAFDTRKPIAIVRQKGVAKSEVSGLSVSVDNAWSGARGISIAEERAITGDKGIIIIEESNGIFCAGRGSVVVFRRKDTPDCNIKVFYEGQDFKPDVENEIYSYFDYALSRYVLGIKETGRTRAGLTKELDSQIHSLRAELDFASRITDEDEKADE
ncbi:MAG: hypothetical protein KDH96_03290 [Candidatus Riesia sp.]|nr:hypothetical protein [Candidatus Riesia sp.]